MTTIDLLKKIYFYVGLKERLLWGESTEKIGLLLLMK